MLKHIVITFNPNNNADDAVDIPPIYLNGEVIWLNLGPQTLLIEITQRSNITLHMHRNCRMGFKSQLCYSDRLNVAYGSFLIGHTTQLYLSYNIDQIDTRIKFTCLNHSNIV